MNKKMQINPDSDSIGAVPVFGRFQETETIIEGTNRVILLEDRIDHI